MLWIPRHDLLIWTLNNINFYLSTFPAKINDNLFQNKEKKPMLGSFLAKGNRSWKPGYVQLQRSPRIQMSKIDSRLAVKPKIIPLLLTCKNWSINLLNSSNHLWDTPDSRVLWSIRPHPFWLWPTYNYYRNFYLS